MPTHLNHFSPSPQSTSSNPLIPTAPKPRGSIALAKLNCEIWNFKNKIPRKRENPLNQIWLKIPSKLFLYNFFISRIKPAWVYGKQTKKYVAKRLRFHEYICSKIFKKSNPWGQNFNFCKSHFMYFSCTVGLSWKENPLYLLRIRGLPQVLYCIPSTVAPLLLYNSPDYIMHMNSCLPEQPFTVHSILICDFF